MVGVGGWGRYNIVGRSTDVPPILWGGGRVAGYGVWGYTTLNTCIERQWSGH